MAYEFLIQCTYSSSNTCSEILGKNLTAGELAVRVNTKCEVNFSYDLHTYTEQK